MGRFAVDLSGLDSLSIKVSLIEGGVYDLLGLLRLGRPVLSQLSKVIMANQNCVLAIFAILVCACASEVSAYQTSSSPTEKVAQQLDPSLISTVDLGAFEFESVPEPSSIVLLGLASLVTLRRRRS